AAEEDARRALELDPGIESLNTLAQVEIAQRRFEPALEHLAVAIRLDSGHIDVYVNRGMVMIRKGEPGAALADFVRATELRPQAPTPWPALSPARPLTGDLDGAEAAATKSLALDPTYADAKKNLARVRLARGDARGSLPLFDAALAANDRLVDGHV